MVVFFISEGFLIAGALIGIYVKFSTKLKELEVRQAQVEKQDIEIITKLDSIRDDISELKVELMNKKNRE